LSLSVAMALLFIGFQRSIIAWKEMSEIGGKRLICASYFLRSPNPSLENSGNVLNTSAGLLSIEMSVLTSKITPGVCPYISPFVTYAQVRILHGCWTTPL